MINKKVVVIDYGMSNTLSVCRALEYCKAKIELTSSSEKIKNADYLVLPGVGAFHEGMQNLAKKNLISPIKEYLLSNKPFLGICLGMQMLLEESAEFSDSSGFGFFQSKVKMLPQKQKKGIPNKLPHISWNKIILPKNQLQYNPILKDIPNEAYFYFVHSFYCNVVAKKYILANTPFHDFLFPSIIKKGNVYGVQFHPEKSGEFGIKILTNFLNIT